MPLPQAARDGVRLYREDAWLKDVCRSAMIMAFAKFGRTAHASFDEGLITRPPMELLSDWHANIKLPGIKLRQSFCTKYSKDLIASIWTNFFHCRDSNKLVWKLAIGLRDGITSTYARDLDNIIGKVDG